MSATLTTTVTESVHGGPATGIRVELWQIAGEMSIPVVTATTNEAGTTDEPLVAAGKLRTGNYELRYSVRDYFGGEGMWDVIPLRFDIRDANVSHHFTLDVSPWAYRTTCTI